MMYTIRAKTLAGNWVEGYYFAVPEFDIHEILVSAYGESGDEYSKKPYEIDPKTICRPIPCLDFNGQTLWENDIVDVNGTAYKRWNGSVIVMIQHGWVLTTDDSFIDLVYPGESNTSRGFCFNELIRRGNVYD